VAFTNFRKNAFFFLLASSFILQGNCRCWAAESSLAGRGNEPAEEETASNVAQSDKPIAQTSAQADTADPVEVMPHSIIDTGQGDSHTILKSPLLLAAGQPADGFVLSGGASISPDQAPDRIDQLTKAILLKEIELERFNLNYTREVAIQGRWKGWRYTGLQEINAGTGLAGAIISVAYRGARLSDSAKVKPCIQESANYIPEIGSYIGAGAAAMEFGINGYHDLIARKHGFSPAESIRKVSGLKNDIDRLMAERSALVRLEATSSALSGQTELDQAEGKVLGDLMDQALQEFERFHVGARRVIAFQQLQFFFDFSKYVTNGIGYEFAYLSLHDHHRRYNGNAGALFCVSGGLTMFAPIVSRFFSKGVADLTRHDIHHAIGHSYKAGVASLEADLANLDRLAKQTRISNASERCIAREGHYEDHQKSYTDEIRSADKAKAKSVLTATQNIGAALYVGGTKVGSGVLFDIVGFNHHYRAKTVRANHVTNDLLFTASLIAIPSGAFSMLDSLRIQVTGEINRHKLAAKGMLPGQLVALRLKQLDQMEQRLKATK
jgi:hypothetical protein